VKLKDVLALHSPLTDSFRLWISWACCSGRQLEKSGVCAMQEWSPWGRFAVSTASLL